MDIQEKEHWLKKEGTSGEFDYIDQDGVSHRSPQGWLWSILGGCGCGSAEEYSQEAVKVLELFATPHEERKWSVYDDRFYEVLAHWFDDKMLIEHGTSINGSWLTEKGEQVYKSIKSLTI